jgi:hypothetical protein
VSRRRYTRRKIQRIFPCTNRPTISSITGTEG